MERYENKGGNSGVSAYEIGDDFILIKFSRNTKIYRYSYRIAGQTHVENLKQLAQNGRGLNAYIKNRVNDLYDK